MKSLNQFIYEVENSEVNGFCVLKPEFLSHTEDFLKMLSNQGWTVVQKLKKKIDIDTAKSLYQMHKDKPFYNDLCDYMSSGDALYCLCQKDCKDPITDMKTLKDKVRKAWGKDDMRNAMHSSDTLANVNRESKLIFENKVMECCCCCGTSNIENTTCCDPGTPLPYNKTYAELQCLGLDGMSPDEYMQYTDMLKQALAEEFKAWYQYHIVIPFLDGEDGTESIKKLFIELADDELNHHATKIMELMKRIDIVPACLFNGYWDNYIPYKHRSDIFSGCTLENVINNITLETGAIDTYVRLVKFTKDKDPQGHAVFSEILADEEEHLDKLQKTLNKYFVK